MKNFKDLVRRLDPSWEHDIGVTAAAAAQVRAVALLLGKSPPSVWREVAWRWVDFRRELGASLWFAQQYRHAFDAVRAGDPRWHPELLAPVCLELAMTNRPQWVLGTSDEFPVAPNYHRLRLLEELRAAAAAEDKTEAPPRRRPRRSG